MEENKGMIHGLVAFEFKGKVMGYISEESIDWGGDDATQVAVWAAQRRDGPVEVLLDSPGTDELTFDLIELKPENLKAVMGGTVEGTKWNAPQSKIIQEGPLKITTASGHTYEAERVALLAKPKGKLIHNDVFKIHCRMTILAAGQKSPYSIDSTTPKLEE